MGLRRGREQRAHWTSRTISRASLLGRRPQWGGDAGDGALVIGVVVEVGCEGEGEFEGVGWRWRWSLCCISPFIENE